MKKLYLIGIILILFLASVIVINSQNVTIDTGTPPSTIFRFENVNVTTKVGDMSFDRIAIDDNYIQFNDTKIYVDSTNPVNITLNYLASNLASLNTFGILGINFTAKCSGGTAWFNISGFTPGFPDEYTFYKNGTLLGTYAADSSGIIHLPISTWSWGYITGVLTGSSGNNIRSDGEYLYMTMEDGLRPYFYNHRATHTIDYNSTMEGKYCLNATYTNTPDGAFYDRLYFDNHIKPTTWSMKFIIDDYTTDEKMSFMLNRHNFGATIMGLDIWVTAHKFDTYVVGTDLFTMPCLYNTIYTITFSDIDYVAHTYDLTISNATASETKANIPFYSSATGNIELDSWEFRGQDAGVNHRLFYDDWTIGQQTLIDSNSATNILATSATANGLIVNDGSTLQNASQENLTAKVYYDTKSHEVNYTYYFNAYHPIENWHTHPERMVDGIDDDAHAAITYSTFPTEWTQLLTNHTGNNTNFPNMNISKAEIRIKAIFAGTSLNSPHGLFIQPVVNGIDRNVLRVNDDKFSNTLEGDQYFSEWIDITSYINNVSNAKNLSCRVKVNLTSNSIYCSIVQVRFTFNLTREYAYNQTVSGNYTGENTGGITGGLTPGQLYFYRAYGQTNYTNASSYGWGDEKYFLTKPEAPTGAKYTIINKTSANLTWTKGTGTNKTIVVTKTTGYPTSVSDGTIVYNGTGTYKVITGLVSGSTNYYRLWGFKNWTFNPTLYHFSDNHTDFPFGALALGCYNESKPWQNITFNIQISNETGSEVYIANGCTTYHTINATLCPHGLITMYFTASGYKGRPYTITLNPGVWLVFDAYLPPLYTATNDTTAVECEIRTYTNSQTITDPTVFAIIPLTYEPMGIIEVELYNKTLYGSYGGWKFIPSDKYGVTVVLGVTSVSVVPSAMDLNTTMVRVTYWYEDCLGIETKLYLLSVVNQNNLPIRNALVSIKRYINTTDIYEPVLSAYTDGNGQIDCYLIPLVPYKVFINASGYIDEIADYTPSLLIFTHTFMMEYEEWEPQTPYSELDHIQFTGVRRNTMLYVNYTDDLLKTINTTIYIYEIDQNGTETLLFTFSNTSEDTIRLQISGINKSRDHKAILFYNHTEFHLQRHTVYMPRETPTIPAASRPMNKLDNFLVILIGYNPIGWGNLLIFFFLVAAFYYMDEKYAGLIMAFLGGIFLMLNVVLAFDSTLFTVAGGAIPILFIIIGVMYEWVKHKRKVA